MPHETEGVVIPDLPAAGPLVGTEEVVLDQSGIMKRSSELPGHVLNTNNPHGVTPGQVGAADAAHNHDADYESSGAVAVHAGDTANPHGVTAGQANAEPAGTVAAHAGQGDAHHDPVNDPAAGEKAALAGTSGVPGAGNPYVTDADPRNTDSREPNAHDLGGAAHGADTLANLNAKVSDATLDDASDPRDPTAHALGGPAHSADTLANLNAKVSDATLDGASDPRTPTEHGNAAHDPDFATEAALVAHEADDSNPHGVTAGQAGADPAGSAAAVAASLGDHVGEEVNGDDPHGVKAFGNAAYVRSEDIRHAAKITQAAYDALEPPDAETLYLIPEAE